jgi:hypothetical protein
MFRATVKKEAVYVSADAQHPKEILNAAGAAMFRKTAADVDSGDTELAAGAAVQITDGHWFVSAGSSEIVVTDVKVGAFEDASTVDDLTVGDKLVVNGEAELNGDLNHDGAKAGFFGAAPAAQPDLKPAAEVTAKELGEALVTLGLIK